MRLPRDLSGDSLIQALSRFDYVPVRQSGSHFRLVRATDVSVHRVTIPRHSPLRVGTLNSILNDIAVHLGITKEELLEELTR